MYIIAYVNGHGKCETGKYVVAWLTTFKKPFATLGRAVVYLFLLLIMDHFKPLEIGRDIVTHLERELQGREGTTVEVNGISQKIKCTAFPGAELNVELKFEEGKISDPDSISVELHLTTREIRAHISEALGDNGFNLRDFRAPADHELDSFTVVERVDDNNSYTITLKNGHGTGRTFSGPNAAHGFPSARPLLVVVRDFLQSGGAAEKLK